MKILKKTLKLAIVVAVVAGVIIAVKKFLEMQSATPSYTPPATEPSTEPAAETEEFDEDELGGEVSEELLSILVDPADKGELELSDDGKWLINPRNGYRYPIRRGIPVMLIEEGKKHQDPSLIREETEPA